MRFHTLGPLQVHDDDGLLPVGGPRERRILAALLLGRDRVVPLHQLVAAVWDGDPPVTAATQVRNQVSRLRRSWSATVPRPAEVLVTDGNGYRIRLDGHTLDLVAYEQQVTQARAAARAGDIESALRLLRSALALWRGPAFAGVGGSVVDAAADRLEQHRLSVAEECLGHELALGRHEHVADEAAALVAAHPFREHLVHHLMSALYRSGRQVDALAAYQRYARRLRDELGLDPVPGLRTLHEAILRRSVDVGPPTVPAPRDASASATTTPSPPRQRTVGSRFGSGPPVRTRPAELPADVADFSGRARETAALDEFLAECRERERGVHIVVVTGGAGTGKTALVTHWAHRASAGFPDGQLHVDLHGHSRRPAMRPIDALRTVLRALGADLEATPTDLDDAARLYRSLLAGRRILLVLDDASSCEQVRPLLPGTPGSVVLVTSRDALTGLVASHGARRLTVGPMEMDEALELLGHVVDESRLRRDPQGTRRLVEACSYRPPDLRVAASHLGDQPHRSVADYAAELRDRGRTAAP